MVILHTNRLVIRDHVYDDLDTMHRLLSDPKAMYYLQDLKTENMEGTLENLKTAIEAVKEPDRDKYFFRIELKDGTYIGEIGFTVRLNTPLGKVVELGYFILPEFWGKGITTEAAAEVVRFAFEEAGVIKLEVGCIRDNQGSESVMQKLKMVKEADYVMRTWHDSCFKDRVEYRLTKEEWERLSKGNNSDTEAQAPKARQ